MVENITLFWGILFDTKSISSTYHRRFCGILECFSLKIKHYEPLLRKII